MKANLNQPIFKGNYAVIVNNKSNSNSVRKMKEATDNFASNGRVSTSEVYLDGEPKGIMRIYSMPKYLDSSFEKLAIDTGFKAVSLDKTV